MPHKACFGLTPREHVMGMGMKRLDWAQCVLLAWLALSTAGCGSERGEHMGSSSQDVANVPNVSIAPKRRNQSEEAVAIDPANANHVFIGSNSEPSSAGVIAAYSTDGGGTWSSSSSAGDTAAND